jgi:hypothetical protein
MSLWCALISAQPPGALGFHSQVVNSSTKKLLKGAWPFPYAPSEKQHPAERQGSVLKV